jgi:1-acyl-sn-glycerol-3-phosphate acyltransferase
MHRFFDRIMRRQMRGHFRAVRLLRPGLPALPAGVPLVIVTNHPSWWDPAFCMVLSTALFPGRESYAPIEAEALERYRFMRRLGVFPVRPGTRAGAVAFLRTGAHVLSDPRRILWVTAQGEFADARARPVRLKAGAAQLLARTPGAVALPLALEYPYWSEKKAEALAAFGDPIRVEGPARAAAWQGALEAGLQAAMDALARAAMARDAAPFDDLLRGDGGVGGTYGAWLRLKAALGGRTYEAEHAADRPDQTEKT